jgi:hypothetical protein
MRAKIIPSGNGLYGVVWKGEIKMYFDTVTAAGIFCIEHFIPFEPWE